MYRAENQSLRERKCETEKGIDMEDEHLFHGLGLPQSSHRLLSALGLQLGGLGGVLAQCLLFILLVGHVVLIRCLLLNISVSIAM